MENSLSLTYLLNTSASWKKKKTKTNLTADQLQTRPHVREETLTGEIKQVVS